MPNANPGAAMPESPPSRAGKPAIRTVVRRALLRRCPNCGEAPLFASYLKQVDRCAACGEPFGHIRSDDAAPWLTVLVVGHLVIPVVVAVERHATWPTWVSTLVWCSVATALMALILPRAKSLLLSIIWATGASGSEAP